MTSKLNVEVEIKADSLVKKNSLTAHVKDELSKRKVVTVGSKISSFEVPELLETVEAIFICELELSGNGDELVEQGTTVIIENVILNIFIYRLNKEGSAAESLECDDSETHAATLCLLPSHTCQGIWDSLIFDSDIKKNLLQYAKAMLHMSKQGVNQQLISCNRVVLLHGPPGTGKTSLCKALAQKLSVRMSDTYPQALLVEINTHGLFSKYFSESGKLVSRLFSKLSEMASDSQTLLFILVDEVESLAHSRASFAGNEPSDAIRVVNALLTHLDMLKEYPNVMVFTTSNITGAIDLAFVDRADIRAYIPQPSPSAIYSIYHSCLIELLRARMIIGTCPEKKIDWKKAVATHEKEAVCKNGINGNGEHLLMELAMLSEGLTGRSLRKVPLRVFSTQISPDEVVRIEDFLSAMMIVVKQMKTEQKEINSSISLQ